MQRPDLAAVRRFHIYADVFLVSLGWLGAYALRTHMDGVLSRGINAFDSYLNALPLVVTPWILSCWLFGIYRPTRMTTLVDQFQLLLRGALVGLLAVSSVSFFVKELSFGRSVVLMSGGLNLLLQGVSRVAFYHVERRMQRSGAHDVRSVIVGTGVTAMRLLQKMQDHPETGYRIVGFLDPEALHVGENVEGRPVLGTLEDLRKIAVEQEIHEVLVAVPSLGHGRMLSLVLECEDLNLVFRIVTNLFEVLTAGTPVDLVEDLPLVRLGRDRIHPLYDPVKRLFDVSASTIALVATLPLWAFCAWRIRRDSPGPAMFRQARVGQGGKTFEIFKFRTMRTDVEPYAEAPRDHVDPRITRFGRWLRRTSLDELPQLLNVLRGEMTLVGPRPEMPFIVATYDEWQRRRLVVKPGITGLWQILGRKDLPMTQNLQYDFYYIRNRSFLMDISILIRTVGVVLSRKGAY